MADVQRPQGAPGIKFDLAVIGAGAAGLSVTYGAARLGLRVALIERGVMGGECLNTGCIPSKILLHAAATAATWPQAQAAIRAGIAAIAPVDSAARYTGLGATVLHGTARFTGRNSLDVNGQHLTARRIVIATGSRTKIPDFCAGILHLTNETIWDLPALPDHLIILGAGPMGAEMASAFAGLGAKVTLIGKFLPREDSDLAAVLATALRRQGVALIDQPAAAATSGPTIHVADGTTISGSHLLLATGRFVDTGGLNLAAAGITAGPDGIATDTGLRAIGNKRIFAAGDCANPAGIGPQRLTHIAGAHAGIIIRRAVFRLPARLPRGKHPVHAIFTTPELAQVGPTIAQAGPGAAALTAHFAENDRAVTESDTTGLIKLVIDNKSGLIGAGIAGPQASEMIAVYALAISQKLKLASLAGLILPYPTRAEAGKRAAGAHLAARLFAPLPQRIAAWLARLP